MKLLYLASWPPFPLHSGGRLRSHHVLRSLRQRHEVQLLTFVAGPRERALAQAEGALAFEYRRTPSNSALPPSLKPFESEELRETLQAMAGSGVQATLFDQIFVSALVELSCGPAILLEQNIESEILAQGANRAQGPQRRALQLQAMALRAYEDRIWPAFALRCCVSEYDRQLMNRRCSQGQTLVLPNGVDLQRYSALPVNSSVEPRLLFVGALDFLPNQDAVDFLVDEVLPRIWQRCPEFRARIVGRDPSEQLCHKLSQDPRLELHANAADLHPLAQDCTLAVVPLRIGSGTRLKILEAAAWGLPVISTALGAQGLDFEPGVHLLQADSADQLAQATLELWQQPERRQQLAGAARRKVEESYDWEQVLAPLHPALEGLC